MLYPKHATVERDELDPTPFDVEDGGSTVTVKLEDEDVRAPPDKAAEPPAKRPRGRPGSRAWTAEDLDQLFSAMTSGQTAKTLEGKVDGRSGTQCLSAWKSTLEPYLRKCVAEKGKRT